MANLIPENIRKLLGRFAFDMDGDSINENLTCTLCGKLMVDAYQTYCDCKYCLECIIRYLDEGNTYCRGGKDECREEHLVLERNVLPNIVLNRQVLRVGVRCPNQSCNFSSKLPDMEEHLRVCSQQPIGCPYTTIGCGIGGGSRDTVETHILKESLVHSELLIEVINNLRNEVGGLKENFCLNKVEIAALREELRLKDRETLARVEEEKKLRREESEELLELKTEIVELKRKIESAEGDSQMKDGDTRVAMVEEDLIVVKEEVKAEKRESRKMRGEVETLKKELERVNDSNARLETEVALLREKMGDGGVETADGADGADSVVRGHDLGKFHGLSIKRVETGPMVELWFTVDRMAERMEGGGGRLESPHLYSHANGYKLRILVDTGYYPGVFGTCLCVSSVLCRGECDDVLPWPCRLTLSVAAVNKYTKQPHKTQTITYGNNTDDRFCGKPIDSDNPPYGRCSLVSHSDIRSSGVITSDSLLLHVVVTR